MNILFVTPYPPSRIRVRSFELLRALAQRDHHITLATIWGSEEERHDLACLAAAGIDIVDFHLATARALTNALLTLPTSAPLQANYCWHPGFAELLKELVRSTCAHLVHIEHLRGARYGLALKAHFAATHRHIPIVWDSVDCITHLFRQAATQSHSHTSRLLARFELGRTSRYEGKLVTQFDRTLVTSPADQAALSELASNAGDPSPRIETIANGVDLAYFTPGDLEQPTRQPATLLFTGKMSYHANATAAQYLVKEIMPLVWRERPEVDLWIVGKNPPRAVSDLTATDTQKPDKIGGRIKVTGTVPDLRTYLRQATIAVAPLLYGAGIQNKVLEAMACGLPVVATPQAVAALHVSVGQDLLVGHTPQAFAHAILTLLASPAQQVRIGQAGRTYVQQHHAWSSAAAQLEAIYLDAYRASLYHTTERASITHLPAMPHFSK